MMPDRVLTNLAYLSLGSNIEPENNLSQAVTLLEQFGTIKAVSSVWQTSPVGFTHQPDFLNAAVLLETALSAKELRMEVINKIENALGRVRTENKNGPRTIDIDIMLFNHDVFKLDWCRIPDPELLQRSFVAIPMAEIAPEYVHPEVDITLKEIALEFNSEAEAFTPRDDVQLVGVSSVGKINR